MTEKSLYPAVASWLARFLKDRYRGSRVHVYDTHATNLNSFIEDRDLHNDFPEFRAYDIKVDLTGVVASRSRTDLAFVECKLRPIRLLDVGQLLGYARIVRPAIALLISPGGISPALETLIRTFGRHDLLDYDHDKRIRLATWDSDRSDILYASLLPPGPISP